MHIFNVSRYRLHPTLQAQLDLTCLNKLYNLSLTSLPGSSLRDVSLCLAFSRSSSNASPRRGVEWKLRRQAGLLNTYRGQRNLDERAALVDSAVVDLNTLNIFTDKRISIYSALYSEQRDTKIKKFLY